MKRDPRPQRQIRWLADTYAVDYVSHINDSSLKAHFIKYPSNPPSFLRQMRLWLLKLRKFDTFLRDHANNELVSKLAANQYDLIIAHHLKLLPVAFRFAGKAKVILDAHEYYTGLYNDSPIWNFFMKEFYQWMSENYLHKCVLTIAVNESIRLLYENNFQIPTISITNASDYVELQPTEVDPNNIRIIHHGLASKSRNLELMIEMMNYLEDRFSLTIILLTINYASQAYVKTLKNMAKNNQRIIFLDVLPQDELIKFCNDYDIGLFFMPPSNMNIEYSLANKFFQYIQSRLMLAVSPLPEMKRLTEAYELGVVGDNYDPKAMAAKLNRLTAADIWFYKNRAHERAKELSSEANREKFLKTVAEVLQ
jgi:glycosyltransferase involved in cell wall biosynthesis